MAPGSFQWCLALEGLCVEITPKLLQLTQHRDVTEHGRSVSRSLSVESRHIQVLGSMLYQQMHKLNIPSFARSIERTYPFTRALVVDMLFPTVVQNIIDDSSVALAARKLEQRAGGWGIASGSQAKKEKGAQRSVSRVMCPSSLETSSCPTGSTGAGQRYVPAACIGQ